MTEGKQEGKGRRVSRIEERTRASCLGERLSKQTRDEKGWRDPQVRVLLGCCSRAFFVLVELLVIPPPVFLLGNVDFVFAVVHAVRDGSQKKGSGLQQ